MPATKTLDFLVPLSSANEKKFNNIDILSQYYETFSFVTDSGANKLRCLSQTRISFKPNTFRSLSLSLSLSLGGIVEGTLDYPKSECQSPKL